MEKYKTKVERIKASDTCILYYLDVFDTEYGNEIGENEYLSGDGVLYLISKEDDKYKVYFIKGVDYESKNEDKYFVKIELVGVYNTEEEADKFVGGNLIAEAI